MLFMSHITLLGGLYYPRSVFLKPTSGQSAIGKLLITNSFMTDLSIISAIRLFPVSSQF